MDASRPMASQDDEADPGHLPRRSASGSLALGYSDPRPARPAVRGRTRGRTDLVDQQNCADDVPARDRHVNGLVNTLERDVIPRLVRAHRATFAPAAIDRAPGEALTAQDITTVTSLALRGDPSDIVAYVEGLQGRGVQLDRIYLELLARVAHRLGVLWEEDVCDFTSVTMGLCALQHVVLQTSRQVWRIGRNNHPLRRAALSPTPGEQHTFGLLIVAEFFRRAGWEVWSGTGETGAGIAAQVRAERYAVAGFTLAGEERLAPLAQVIRQVRRASLNRDIGILVGGPLFIAHPELVLEVGADATAADGSQAVLQAETLLALDGARA